MDEIVALASNALEKARRAGRYRLMRHLAKVVMTEAEILERREGAFVRCRVLYELHMAAYQRAMATDGKLKRALVLRSLDFVKESKREAQAAHYSLGALYAQMNISGLIYPALDRWE